MYTQFTLTHPDLYVSPSISPVSLPYISRPHVETLHQSAPSLPLVTSQSPSLVSPHLITLYLPIQIVLISKGLCHHICYILYFLYYCKFFFKLS